jgi:ABC-type glycerol-3-phosphate transport system substrate-binding protein
MPTVRPHHLILALVAGLCLPLAACGSESENVATVTETQTVTERASETADESRQNEADSPKPDTSSDSEAMEASASGSSEAKSIEVPDVEGVDHQLAQATMQAAGLYNLTEEDASGEDRSLLWDRNWTVVTQSPKAGERVSEDATIILRSVKDEEYEGK